MLKQLTYTIRLLFAAFLSFAVVHAFSQAPASPDIECVIVAANGDIILNWTPPADPGGMGIEYRISRLVNGGPDEPIAVINDFAANSYVVTTHNGNVAAFCFYIETTYMDGIAMQAPAGATACSVFLTANGAVVPGIVQLGWNQPFLEVGTTGTLTVLMEYPTGTWSILAEYPYSDVPTNHNYQVDICTAFLQFQVVYSGISPCDFGSNVVGGVYQDQIDPSAPEIISVSVDSLSHNAILFWNPPPEADVAGYIIYQCQPGFNPVPLDTIFDPNILFWQNPNSQANLGVEYYNIAAFDSCLAPSGDPDPGPGNPICGSTIHLTHQWTPCTDDVILSWTPYNGWVNGVESYEIYVAEEPVPGSGNFEPSSTLAVVAGNTTTYTHSDVNLGSSYRYRVRAIASGSDYEAFSNRRTATVFYPASPAYTYIREATVIDRSSAQVNVSIGPGFVTEHIFTLERKRSGTDDYDLRDASILTTDGNLVFLDDVTSTDDHSYTYRIRVTNSCGDEITVSNEGETILLSGFINRDNLTNIIRWTPYRQWNNGVQRYEVYRWVGDAEFPELLATLPPNARDYTDDVGDLLNTPGEFCYRVIAVESPNGFTPPGRPESNLYCLTQEPVIWVPNAFIINGFNNTFSPVISFADFSNYRMQVYSRWGDLVFETTDIDDAWDGIYRDRLVPEGMYAWFISITDGAGRLYEKRGRILMMVGPEN